MIDYSLRELECFVAVAEELSFTRAARRLRLAQPPLSRHIQSLESRLGTKLFLRAPRTVVLTAAGRAFLADTKGTLAQLQRAGDSAKRAANGETSRLALGFVSAVLNPKLMGVFQRYRARHPAVQLTLHTRCRSPACCPYFNGAALVGVRRESRGPSLHSGV